MIRNLHSNECSSPSINNASGSPCGAGVWRRGASHPAVAVQNLRRLTCPTCSRLDARQVNTASPWQRGSEGQPASPCIPEGAM
ncbi:hypothetical protein E2C01_045487 [Portunus trituberculatus]|uniref:Uncharacterized protein n=1 Tax=Portunus trituberculatus TaxID=210409 RepID=A0A5B7G1C1_PORTR|nr:hypothetical protein [Portunus trituberculatus]